MPAKPVHTRYDAATPYTTKDGSTIRELMHPAHAAVRQLSVAEATVAPDQATLPHCHLPESVTASVQLCNISSLLRCNVSLHQACHCSPRRPAGRPITAHLLCWQLADILPVSSTSLPPCICTVLERSRIQDLVSEEVYHILAGEGRMTLGEAVLAVRAGDTVVIVPGTTHAIANTGATPLRLLCCCAPPYRHEDTFLTGGNATILNP